jgi:hypothetical protein
LSAAGSRSSPARVRMITRAIFLSTQHTGCTSPGQLYRYRQHMETGDLPVNTAHWIQVTTPTIQIDTDTDSTWRQAFFLSTQHTGFMSPHQLYRQIQIQTAHGDRRSSCQHSTLDSHHQANYTDRYRYRQHMETGGLPVNTAHWMHITRPTIQIDTDTDSTWRPAVSYTFMFQFTGNKQS